MPNILIVEDEEAIRRVLKKVLSEDDSKNNILEASDGVEAINKIKTENLQLVICDIKMPKKDGLDVLNFLKSYDDKIPIIMISGHGDLKTAVAKENGKIYSAILTLASTTNKRLLNNLSLGLRLFCHFMT